VLRFASSRSRSFGAASSPSEHDPSSLRCLISSYRQPDPRPCSPRLPPIAFPNETRRERVMGIEPTLPAWKAGTLPLSYTRVGRHRVLPARPVGKRVWPGPEAWAARAEWRFGSGRGLISGCVVSGPRPFPVQYRVVLCCLVLLWSVSFAGRGQVGGAGFEPAKALPPDLQSGPFGRLGIHPSVRLGSTRRAPCGTPRLPPKARRRAGQSWR
jgi:hypothetical protein